MADGSVIEAPPGPYKTRPENPDGKRFEGTGNIAPAVGEGQTREGRLAQDTAAPPVAVEQPGDEEDEGKAEADAPRAGPVVQVAAYSSRADAQAGWQALMRQTEALAGVGHRIVEGQADIGTVYRLQATPGSLAAANALCTRLKADGLACQVKR